MLRMHLKLPHLPKFVLNVPEKDDYTVFGLWAMAIAHIDGHPSPRKMATDTMDACKQQDILRDKKTANTTNAR